MATRSFYLNNAAVGGTQYGTLQEGTSPTITAGTTTHGWVVAKLAATRYAVMDFGTELGSATFVTTDPLSTTALSNTVGNAWRSENAYSGVFASANWTFSLAFRPSTTGAIGRPRIQLWKGSAADGSNATRIGAVSVPAAGQTLNSTAATFTFTSTVNPGAQTFSNEYLFVQVEWEITGTGAANGSNSRWYIAGTGATAAVVTSDFSPAVVASAIQTTSLPSQTATSTIVSVVAATADQTTALPTQAATGTVEAYNQAVVSWFELSSNLLTDLTATSSLDLDFTTGLLDSRVTFSRPSMATIYDSTGKLAYAPHNLAQYSQDSSGWSVNNGPTFTTGIDDPLGGNNAVRVAFTTLSQSIGAIVPAQPGGTLLVSFWARYPSSNAYPGSLNLRDGGIQGQARFREFTPTTSWRKFALSFPSLAAGQVQFEAGPQWDLVSASTGDVEFFGWQVEATESLVPSSYNPTSASAYYGPRFDHDPVTHESRGLLNEEQRTNIQPRSQDFADGSWLKEAVTLGGTVTAPDGTNTGRTVNVLPAGDALLWHHSGTFSAGAIYTLTLWAKSSASGGATKFRMNSNNSFAWNTGVGQKYNLTSQWQRFVLTGVFTNSGDCNIHVVDTRFPVDGSNDTDTALIGSIDIWGAQVELGAFPTSYIPTTTTAVTRALDIAMMTGTNFSSWFTQPEGSVVVAARFMTLGVMVASNPYIFAAHNAAATEGIYLRGSGTVGRFDVLLSGALSELNTGAGSFVTLGPHKVAVAYRSNDRAAVANGGTVYTAVDAYTPQAPDRASLGGIGGD